MSTLVTNNADSERKTIQVLYVDDNEDHFIIAKRQIEKFDPLIKLNYTFSPNDVLEQLDSFDCIVLDYLMPNFDGIQLAFTIRETSNIPLIIYTGHGGEDVASAAFEAGADDYIRKESDANHYQILANRIRKAVAHKCPTNIFNIAYAWVSLNAHDYNTARVEG